jgi:hypothetical protein
MCEYRRIRREDNCTAQKNLSTYICKSHQTHMEFKTPDIIFSFEEDNFNEVKKKISKREKLKNKTKSENLEVAKKAQDALERLKNRKRLAKKRARLNKKI